MIQNNVLNNVDSEITWYKFEKYSCTTVITKIYTDTDQGTWSSWWMVNLSWTGSKTAYSSYTYNKGTYSLSGGSYTISYRYPGQGYWSAGLGILSEDKVDENKVLTRRTKTALVDHKEYSYSTPLTLDSTIQSPSELYPQQEELGYTFVENTSIDGVNYIIMKDSSNQFWAFKKVS